MTDRTAPVEVDAVPECARPRGVRGTVRAAVAHAAVAGAAAVVLVTTAVPPAGPAAAQDVPTVDGGPCAGPEGVTVVVDFQELGDDTVAVRCAEDRPTDGLDALRQAGVHHRTTVAFPGFVCRIADRPDDDPCDTASPADAYWSYWLAPRGGAWCYSNKGAANRTPPLGSVEGWSFALDRTSDDVPPPRFDPPAPLPGVEPTPLAADDCTTAAASGVGAAAAAGRDDATAPRSTPAAGGRVDLAAPEATRSRPWGTIAGVAVVVAVGALAVVRLRRRPDRDVAGATEPPPASVLDREDRDVRGGDDHLWAPPSHGSDP